MNKITKYYLVLYNALSVVLWFIILVQTIANFKFHESPLDKLTEAIKAYSKNGFPHKFLFYVQILNAVVEVMNAYIGLVKSPFATLYLQFSARLLIVVGVSYVLPDSPGNYHISYSGLSLAWSLTEVIRYGFYIAKLLNHVPYPLMWLRYSAFLVLYPVGLVCEASVVYLSLSLAKFASLGNLGYFYFLVFALLMYVPGFLILYSYMLKQRSKVLPKATRKKVE
ncbi:uncharacterized protein PRCAT00004217001 [Priceomyces carsonii]|uniref:uncharacterized protein n=1 Tax=Priceomyces carsonii TaxID=28549 RepID=UPI002ED96090|nr:unnamed protein product [Priceomyces carsonii]